MSMDATNRLVDTIRERTGQNAYLCYQCVTCSAGCPLSEHMDLLPNQVMRALQVGSDDRALASKTIWLCASCQTCSTRCPQGLDVARIMDTLKVIALERGKKPAVPAVATFQSVFLRDVRLLGRSYEPGLIVEINQRTRNPLKDVGMGLKMAAKGKVRLLPEVARLPKTPKRRAQPGEIAYYPGCSLHSLSSELDVSTRAVAGELGLSLAEPDGWICCGSSAAHGQDHVLATTMPMQNLALMEKGGFEEVVAPCSACYFRFRSALHDVRADHDLAIEVARRSGYAYQDSLRVLSVLDLLADRVGTAAIAARVTKSLRGLRVVSYYGCLLSRPPAITGEEHPENPQQMDRIVAALGGEAVDWSYKTDCCGGSLSLTKTELALELTRKLLLAAKALDADAITTSCPMCHVNVDARQSQSGLDFSIPVLYVTQLMGLAFGLAPGRLALAKNMISPQPVLDRIG
jgi:heterodisulfide reductase subunit B